MKLPFNHLAQTVGSSTVSHDNTAHDTGSKHNL